jgi:hypothetical protein
MHAFSGLRKNTEGKNLVIMFIDENNHQNITSHSAGLMPPLFLLSYIGGE